MTDGAFDAAQRVLADAVTARVTPGAAAEVGAADGMHWRAVVGAVSFDDGAPPVTGDTPYDLASLTKPLATATLVVDLAARGAVDLDRRVAHYLDAWRGADRESVTLRDLLEHASGLPARLLDAPPEGRRAFEHEIAHTPLEYAPRSASLYSDLGFILLGFIAEDTAGRALDEVFANARRAVASAEPDVARGELRFATPDNRVPGAAPTMPLDDDRRRGRRLDGEVHDSYAAALSGVAGHSGLFGNVVNVSAVARAFLRAARNDGALGPPLSPQLVRTATSPSAVPGSSRALGWDTMRPTSSCGTRMSARAFGHVGFTGTSLWIDPERNRYYVLLTNRVCGGGSSDEMQRVRRAFHDALADV